MIIIFTCLGRMVEWYDVRRTDAYVILTPPSASGGYSLVGNLDGRFF